MIKDYWHILDNLNTLRFTWSILIRVCQHPRYQLFLYHALMNRHKKDFIIDIKKHEYIN